MRDVLRDAWAYQEIMEEGREEERQQRLKDQRQMLMTFVQAHFPKLAHLAKEQADAINNPEALQNLSLRLLAAQTEEQARQVLLERVGDKQES